MRLDKYLKVSRLIKRRTVANEACDNQRVTANGRPVRTGMPYPCYSGPSRSGPGRLICRLRAAEKASFSDSRP